MFKKTIIFSLLLALSTSTFATQISCPTNKDFDLHQGHWGSPYVVLKDEAKKNWFFAFTDPYYYVSDFSPAAKLDVTIYETMSICNYTFADTKGKDVKLSVINSKYTDVEKIKKNRRYTPATKTSGATNPLYTCSTTAGNAASCPIEIND